MTFTRTLVVLPLLLLQPACEAYRPVAVRVIDGESRAPVAGAVVEPFYNTGLNFTRPARSLATADAAGRAVVRMSDRDAFSRGVRATAPAYLPGEAGLSRERLDVLRYRYDVPADAPADLTVELYREPHPSFLLIVPDGYRGLLRLEHKPLAAAGVGRLAPGQRVLEVAVRPPAPQRLPWTTLGGQHAVEPIHFRARYADGRPIPVTRPATGDPQTVALRWLNDHNGRHLFFVGTAGDLAAARLGLRNYPADFERVWDEVPGP